MKPQSKISGAPKSFRGEAPVFALPSPLPATDYHYLGSSGEFRGRDGSRNAPVLPSFHQLSTDFIRSEMKRDYLEEAVCFLIIVAISTWPIVSMLRALTGPIK